MKCEKQSQKYNSNLIKCKLLRWQAVVNGMTRRSQVSCFANCTVIFILWPEVLNEMVTWEEMPFGVSCNCNIVLLILYSNDSWVCTILQYLLLSLSGVCLLFSFFLLTAIWTSYGIYVEYTIITNAMNNQLLSTGTQHIHLCIHTHTPTHTCNL